MKLSNRVLLYKKLVAHVAAYSLWISLVIAYVFGLSTAICAAIGSSFCILVLLTVMVVIDHFAFKNCSLNDVELLLGSRQIDSVTAQTPIEHASTLVHKALELNKVRNIQIVNDDNEFKLIQGFIDGTWLYPGSKLTICVSATDTDESKITITCQPDHEFNHLDNGKNALTVRAILKTVEELSCNSRRLST